MSQRWFLATAGGTHSTSCDRDRGQRMEEKVSPASEVFVDAVTALDSGISVCFLGLTTFPGLP